MGRLTVIEGLDGSGKATQARLLMSFFDENKVDYKAVSFPDYSNPSSSLVKMYLNGDFGERPEDVNPYAASTFYAVDRYASFKRHWQKDYESGRLILADRYATSNAIYQLTKIGREGWDDFLLWMEDFEYKKLGIPAPDTVVYLDVEPEISQSLLSARYDGDENKKDIHEKNMEYLLRCRECALYCAGKMGWHVIECGKNGAMRPPGEINEEIKEVLNVGI